MALSLLRRLQTLVPYGGSGDPWTVATGTLRLTLVLAVVMNPVYWAVYHVTAPGAIDPLWARLVLMGVSLLLLASSYSVGAVREHPQVTIAVYVHAILLYFGWLAAANHLEAGYAVGYSFVMLAAAMVYSIAWTEARPLVAVMLTSLAIGIGATLTVDPALAELDPLVFALCMGSGTVVVTWASYGRLRITQDLENSRGWLADAERLAQTGAWILDLRTGRRTWTQGAYDVLGISPTLDDPPSLLDVVLPVDRGACQAELDRLLRNGTTSDIRFRIARPDGAVRWLHSIAEVERGRDGTPTALSGVFLDVTEQMAREDALRQARDAAEAAVRAKSEFLANMSHEIRTPLTAIIGFAQLLGEETGEAHADLVAPIEAGGRRLLGTLNSVLDLARMEAGHADLVVDTVDAGAEAYAVAQMLAAQAAAQGVSMHVVAPEAPVLVAADPDALARVLTNLASNAVKFTTRGSITLGVRTEAGRAVLSVQDTGRGMEPAFLREIFEPFRQASTGWARSHEGTGLGLAIVKRLVEGMRGTVEVQSTPGQGTLFLVGLPLAEPFRLAPVAETPAVAKAVARPAVTELEPVAG